MLMRMMKMMAGAAALGAGAYLARAYRRDAIRRRPEATSKDDDWMASAADVERSPSPKDDETVPGAVPASEPVSPASGSMPIR